MDRGNYKAVSEPKMKIFRLDSGIKIKKRKFSVESGKKEELLKEVTRVTDNS